ncbi:MAG: hydantoinase/oxoprolinase family protein, partial [Deinococcales bacterium]
ALGARTDDVATAVLEAAAEKLTRTVRAVADDYRLRSAKLYGGGGAARVLGPVVAARLGMAFECVPEPDVISSVGAALTLIRVERERNVGIDDPTVSDLLLREVEGEAVRLGADPARLQAEVHYLPEERLLRAVAFGAHPVDGHQGDLDDEVLRTLARQQLGAPCEVRYRSPALVVLSGERQERRLFSRVTRRPLVAMDRRGARLLELDDATTLSGAPNEVLAALEARLDTGRAPSVHAVTPRRLIDCSHLNDPEALKGFLRDAFRLEAQVALVLKES